MLITDTSEIGLCSIVKARAPKLSPILLDSRSVLDGRLIPPDHLGKPAGSNSTFITCAHSQFEYAHLRTLICTTACYNPSYTLVLYYYFLVQ